MFVWPFLELSVLTEDDSCSKLKYDICADLLVLICVAILLIACVHRMKNPMYMNSNNQWSSQHDFEGNSAGIDST